jgi:hypothetical protein
MSFYFILLEQADNYVMEFPSNFNLASEIALLAINVAYSFTPVEHTISELTYDMCVN